MSVRTDPKLALLRSVPGFANVRDRDLAALGALFDEVRVDAGQVLARKGQWSNELMLIIDGEARVVRRGSEHEVQGHDLLGAGALVGDSAILDHAPHEATVISETPVRALVAGPGSMHSVMAHPAVVRTLAASLAHRLRVADG